MRWLRLDSLDDCAQIEESWSSNVGITALGRDRHYRAGYPGAHAIAKLSLALDLSGIDRVSHRSELDAPQTLIFTVIWRWSKQLR